MRHFIIKRSDGGVSFMHLHPFTVIDEETGETVERYGDPQAHLAKWIACAEDRAMKDIERGWSRPNELPVVAFEEIADKDLPQGCRIGDRPHPLRDCIGHDLKLDMGKARKLGLAK